MILAQEGTVDDLMVIDDNAAKNSKISRSKSYRNNRSPFESQERDYPEITCSRKMKKNGFYISESLEQLKLRTGRRTTQYIAQMKLTKNGIWWVK